MPDCMYVDLYLNTGKLITAFCSQLVAADVRVSSETRSSLIVRRSQTLFIFGPKKVRESPRSVQDADGTGFHHPATGDASFPRCFISSVPSHA